MEKTINHFQQKENQFEDQQQQPSQSAYSEKHNTSQSEPKPDVISSEPPSTNPKKRQLPTTNGNAPKKQKANHPHNTT